MANSRQVLRRRLETIAFTQAGFFTAAQALAAGYSYQAQKYHVDAGNWVRVDRGLFRLPSWPDRPDDQFVLWTLWSGGRGVISHDSALQVHDLSDIDPASVHLTVPPGFRATDPLVTTHIASLPKTDIERREAWSVTTPLRTLADVAASQLSQEHIDQAVADALDRGLATRRTLLHRTANLPERPALRLERALARREES
ncbi:MAG: type IV toxin-antitoxin system AbiEi family antitoxin domain-containing protein [Propionibacteriaceae bacterium]|jgi:predicted transcriptional regulator of viral defense system|nr:type IV toxin-antitoxin system AbiEi family antitoxin domain-containing protein [Propionibacteriaceae bacterium]